MTAFACAVVVLFVLLVISELINDNESEAIKDHLENVVGLPGFLSPFAVAVWWLLAVVKVFPRMLDV
ncbi:MAG: hypothetical protein NTY30_03625 [Candidatus Berkelbacteria bacterium]|nr:hypothetical protein [Candidatus Berkelbacteria bacterium]